MSDISLTDPKRIFRRVVRRMVGGRPYSEIVRRLAAPNRFRDDLSVDGAWRYSEAFDGARARHRDRKRPRPKRAGGEALDAYRWIAARLDHFQPLETLTKLGCTVEAVGRQKTFDGQDWSGVLVSMLDDTFAEMLYLDSRGRVAAHHMELPPVEDEDRDLESIVRAWDECEGLAYPAQSTVVDRKTGEVVADVVVVHAAFEPFDAGVFDLSTP